MATKHREMALDIAETMRQHHFSMHVNIFSSYLPPLKLHEGDLDELRCDVLHSEESGVRSSRGSYEHSYRFRIGFRKKIGVTEKRDVDVELDKITVVVEEVLDLWKRKRPTHAHGALASFETITPVELSDLNKSRIALCELALTFQGTRDL